MTHRSLQSPSNLRQRGVALITALIIMAIAAAIAAGMVWQGDLDTRRTETLIHGDQALEYALGAESWAEQIMQRDFKQNSASVNLGRIGRSSCRHCQWKAARSQATLKTCRAASTWICCRARMPRHISPSSSAS